MRGDPRTVPSSERSLRSINLAVSDRGIQAMQYVDEEMTKRILRHVIPMKGRMIHDVTGKKQESQLYGLFGESINSIDRLFLNKCLLDELDRSHVTTKFGHKLISMKNTSRPELTFDVDGVIVTEAVDFAVGADGAHSQFRYHMQKGMRMDVAQKYIDMQYLELYIPPVKGADAQSSGRFAIDANHLHIWPRKDYMLIALANGDGLFTSTFFSPWKVIEQFGSNADAFVDFFQKSFPDAFQLIGEEGIRYAFLHQPRGSLMQVAANPYSSPNNRAILIGDAAHSMVPFYGQGMNCGFEDVHVLMKLLDGASGDLAKAISQYTNARKDDLDAICKLALDNYKEMSTKVIDPLYLVRKKIDYFLGKYVNGSIIRWIPMYTMISFRGDIRYSEAVRIEKRQRKILTVVQYVGIAAAAVAVAMKWRK